MLDVHWDIGATVGSGLVLCGLGISRGLKMAEREGFEPPIPVKVYTLSRRAPSATRPSLRTRLAPGILSVLPTAGPSMHRLTAIRFYPGYDWLLHSPFRSLPYSPSGCRGRSTSDGAWKAVADTSNTDAVTATSTSVKKIELGYISVGCPHDATSLVRRRRALDCSEQSSQPSPANRNFSDYIN